MEETKRLERLQSSIEGLKKLSDELAARSDKGHNPDELKPASALLAQYCEALGECFERLSDGQTTRGV